jgi:hypothetical protein
MLCHHSIEPPNAAAQLSLSLGAPKCVPASHCCKAPKPLFVLRKPNQGSGITLNYGIENIPAIEMRPFAHGGRRGPISVRAALGSD